MTELCKKCIYCKIIKNVIYCRNGKFTNKVYSDIIFFTPILFDCEEYEEV
jgi:hypothetical protein